MGSKDGEATYAGGDYSEASGSGRDASVGKTVGQVVQPFEISAQTFHRWLQQHPKNPSPADSLASLKINTPAYCTNHKARAQSHQNEGLAGGEEVFTPVGMGKLQNEEHTMEGRFGEHPTVAGRALVVLTGLVSISASVPFLSQV